MAVARPFPDPPKSFVSSFPDGALWRAFMLRTRDLSDTDPYRVYQSLPACFISRFPTISIGYNKKSCTKIRHSFDMSYLLGILLI